MSGVPNDQERQGLHTFYNGTDNDFQRNLLGNLGSSAIHTSEEIADASGQDVDVGFGGDDDALRLLQQLAAEQSQLLEQLNVANSSTAQTVIRPSEQFLTIAANGTILEATETVTGFSPTSLLMTSIFDGVHPDDLLGLKAIKKSYWDLGNLEIEAYFRRKNVEKEYIWVAGKVFSAMQQPIPGLVMQERRPEDEDVAESINKLTRIAANVASTIDESFSWKNNGNNASIASSSHVTPAIPGLADEAAALKAFLGKSSTANSTETQALHNMMETAMHRGQSTQESIAIGGMTFQKKGGEISSVLEIASEGPGVHVNKMMLSPAEVKMIVLLLTGQIGIDELAQYMLNPKTKEIDLDSFLQPFVSRAHNHFPKVPAHQQHRRRRAPHDIGDSTAMQTYQMPLHQSINLAPSPPIASINISYSAIEDDGMESFSGVLYIPSLKTLDLSFCCAGERGILALCRALHGRRKKGFRELQGLIMSGNTISFKAAKELGSSLSPVQLKKGRKRRSMMSFRHEAPKEGYAEDDEYGSDDDDDDDDDDDMIFGGGGKRRHARSKKSPAKKEKNASTTKKQMTDDPGIKVLHLSSASLTGSAVLGLLLGLQSGCMMEELDISSNYIGSEGVSLLVDFLEGNNKKKTGAAVMPKLNRMNLSNNNLCNDGIAKLTRAISKRRHMSMVDLHLSFNNIESAGTGTLMNKLLQHNLVSLSLDNNAIGDSGCQLVAASLPSMHYLSRLNLNFNQIGCRGITSLMRSLLGCETITYLGLSGNVMKISGAIAMGFALAHHPRLAHIDLDNCCLTQVAQCHISAGMISNRWVPMQTVNGFRVGPPLAAIGALDLIAQHLSNSESLSIRRNMQMKANLQWMDAQKASKLSGANLYKSQTDRSQDFLSIDFIAPDGNGPPSHSAYLRMLDWLSRIPFDEDELDNLRRYFYDIDDESPDGLRGSDGRLNLKVRGDLLAALGSNLEQEMRETEKNIIFPEGSSIGLGLTENDYNSDEEPSEMKDDSGTHVVWNSTSIYSSPISTGRKRTKRDHESNEANKKTSEDESMITSAASLHRGGSFSSSSLSKGSICQSESGRSTNSMCSQGEKDSKSIKARISMFPQFLDKLDLLKSNAQDMMDAEIDPLQQDVIAQQFAEASLILLRQLRYHCMNSGLDGWRQGKIRRKVLIVDDSMVTRKLVARAFEKANFIVDTAQNGEEGVSMMKESIYDIAFMDIDMPVMNGFDATKALRVWENSSRPGARQPICALTAAYVDDFELSELMKFKEAGLDVMESKPCNIPRLFKVVDDVSPMFSDLSISVTQHQ